MPITTVPQNTRVKDDPDRDQQGDKALGSPRRAHRDEGHGFLLGRVYS
jgi:hypothetical protein